VARTPSACHAPHYLAEELLHAEGFTEVEYVELGDVGSQGIAKSLGEGRVDLTMNFVGPQLAQIDAGSPIVFLSGGHVGCYELVATGSIQSLRDLKGKRVGVPDLGTTYMQLVAMVSYVGMDPRRDVDLQIIPTRDGISYLQEGKLDAYLAFPTQAQEIRVKGLARSVVNSAVDLPWSQYFCCLLASNWGFVRKHPEATKRAMRAIFKAADLCVLQPEQAGQYLVDRNFANNREYAVQLMRDVPYGKWRDYDPADTIRFFGLRLREAGVIKIDPNTVIEKHTEFRFLNELKRAIKG
jgi:NitT/TauT family transport system substrate-binding protein